MHHNLAELLMLAALFPLMLVMSALLCPLGLIAASAWRGSRDPAPRPAAPAVARTPLSPATWGLGGLRPGISAAAEAA